MSLVHSIVLHSTLEFQIVAILIENSNEFSSIKYAQVQAATKI